MRIRNYKKICNYLNSKKLKKLIYLINHILIKKIKMTTPNQSQNERQIQQEDWINENAHTVYGTRPPAKEDWGDLPRLIIAGGSRDACEVEGQTTGTGNAIYRYNWFVKEEVQYIKELWVLIHENVHYITEEQPTTDLFDEDKDDCSIYKLKRPI